MKRRLQEYEVIMVQQDGGPSKLETCLTKVNSMLRAMHLWFHSAHNVAYGMPFKGDHKLYKKIYEAIQDEVDDFIERSIGLTRNQDMGCPIKITSAAEKIVASLPSPSSLKGCEVSEAGRDIVEAYLALLEVVYKELESSNELTLGLDDLIMSSANTHEGYFYMLHQRATKER